LGVLGFINVYFECIWTTILHVYSSIIININGFDIMVPLISVYFEYIKFLCKKFTKYIVPILLYKFIQTILLYFLKYYKWNLLILILYVVFILITCNKIFNSIISWLQINNNNILLHNDHNDDDIRMIGKNYIITEIITKNLIYYYIIILLFSNN